jgi:hypothetical protein
MRGCWMSEFHKKFEGNLASPCGETLIYAHLKNKDKTLQHLEDGFEHHRHGLQFPESRARLRFSTPGTPLQSALAAFRAVTFLPRASEIDDGSRGALQHRFSFLAKQRRSSSIKFLKSSPCRVPGFTNWRGGFFSDARLRLTTPTSLVHCDPKYDFARCGSRALLIAGTKPGW